MYHSFFKRPRSQKVERSCDKVTLEVVLKKDVDFYPIWHEKPYASLPISLLLLITGYITVDCLVTFLWSPWLEKAGIPCKHTVLNHLLVTLKFLDESFGNGSENRICVIHRGKLNGASVLNIYSRCWLIEMFHMSKIKQHTDKAGSLPNVTWLPDIHSSRWIMSVAAAERCWFVIWTDKLKSSVQVCLAWSLHEYVTLPQVHAVTLSLSSR